MSVKPFDWIGLEMGARHGKCEFGPYTNTVEPATLETPSLRRMTEMLRNMPSDEEIPHTLAMGKDYLGFVRKHLEIKDVMFPWTNLGTGLRVLLDDDLIPDICEVRNSKGKLLKTLKLEP